MIKYFKEDTTFNFKGKRKCNAWIKTIIHTNRLSVGDINIIFCSDNYILEINNKYLKHNYYTDVITFDYCEGKYLNGDIIISIDTVKENAVLYKTTFENELHRVIIHGVLHLIGYKDKNAKDKKLMKEAEESALIMRGDII